MPRILTHGTFDLLPKKLMLHLFSLVRDAASMSNLISEMNDAAPSVVVDLGCGKKKVAGAIGVDAKSLPGVDIVHDIGKDPLPFKVGSVDVIYANMILEHVPDLLWTMGDIHRVLKPGGVLKAKVPYFNSLNAYSDPTHKNFFTEKTFLYFTREAELNYYVDYKFTLVKQELRNNATSWAEKARNFLPFKHLLKNLLFNMFDEIYVELKKEG
jgi:predicted SAM-dependent methyltransferase